jgi:hypothetical protein
MGHIWMFQLSAPSNTTLSLAAFAAAVPPLDPAVVGSSRVSPLTCAMIGMQCSAPTALEPAST